MVGVPTDGPWRECRPCDGNIGLSKQLSHTLIVPAPTVSVPPRAENCEPASLLPRVNAKEPIGDAGNAERPLP